MKKLLFVLVGIVAAGFAFWLGAGSSDEFAMAFLGILCGIVASIPVSVGLLILLTRDRSVGSAFQPETETSDPNRALHYGTDDAWTVTRPEPKQIEAGQ